jgi:hypothetical protein
MKKTTTLFLLACISLISIGSRALAQDADAMKKYTDFMTPGDMQKILAAANGKWSEDITLWMAPGQPPSKSTGTIDYKMILSVSVGSLEEDPAEYIGGKMIIGKP